MKMNKKIRRTPFLNTRIIGVFFTRRYMFALAAILFAGASAAASLLLPTTYAGMQELSDTETVKIQPDRRPIRRAGVPAITNKNQDVWSKVESSRLSTPADGLPDNFKTFQLDKQALVALLADAPHESNVPLGRSEIGLKLPYPDGTLREFRIQEAPVLEPSLAASFPDIKSYRAISVDDPGTTGRFDLSPRGFYATILSPGKAVSILPADKGDKTLYASYDGDSLEMAKNENFSCSVGAERGFDAGKLDALTNALPPVTAVPINRKLKTYRIAIATTYEYTTDPNLGGGTYASTVASLNTWINALNAIFERDLSIRLLVVAPSNIIETAQNDPYQDPKYSAGPPVINEVSPGGVNFPIVRRVLRDRVGIANYNIGHLFRSNWGGGVGGLNSVCDNTEYNNEGPWKGAGETGFKGASNGNLGSLKVLAHEIGHQFGANHTMNGLACSGDSNTTPPYGNRSPGSAYEVGSGNTIMSYHGVCGTDNVVGGFDESLRFHSHSFTQITDHVYNGIGSTCGEFVDISNSPPEIVQPESYTIPKFTPFTLTTTASDPDLGDNNNLTYTWEQYQPGGVWTPSGPNFTQEFGAETTYNDALDPFNTTRPIFRPMPATTSPSRTFPSLTYILNNANDPPHKEGKGDTSDRIIGEELPRIGRALNFRVTVRDTLGGVAYKEVGLTVAGGAGPFRVTAPETSFNWSGGTTQTVTWDVANTNVAPVNTLSVKILLSTDGGQTFTILLKDAANNQEITPNDGEVVVNIPNNINTAAARIKIQAVENIFFDISGANFTITPSAGSCPIVSDIFPKVNTVGSQVQITGANFTGVNAVVFSGNIPATNFTVNSSTQITATVPAGTQGGEIKISKPGCGAAPSGRFTLCSGTAVPTNLVDDGTRETNGYAADGTNYFVNRLTPTSYPATLSEVRIYHPSSGFPIGKAIKILSAANPTGGEDINNLKFDTRAATVEAHNTFVTYKVDPITIYSGDFVVGYSFDKTANETYFPVAVDDRAASNPYPNPLDPAYIKKRSYSSGNGSDFYIDINKNFMIRAVAFSNPSSSISVSDDTIEFNGGAFAGMNYAVNRITPSSYPATLSEVRIFHPVDGFPVGKAVKILSAAHQNGSANIDNEKFNTRDATITERGSYVSYQVDPITIHQGDFIVGYSFDRTGTETSAPISLDTTVIRNRSYHSTSVTNFGNALTTANFMIRGAVTSPSPCSNGACTYSVALTSGNISGAGGSGTVSIITQSGCPWKASRNVSWITLNQGTTVFGSGSGTVNFAVEQNTGTARIGGITVFGQIITVPQNTPRLQPEDEDPVDPEIFETQEVTVAQQAALQPTAASAAIGGRVLTSAGRGVSNTLVVLTAPDGLSVYARTNSFGYFRFDDVPSGQSYVVTVQNKRYRFAPRVLTLNQAIDEFNMIAEP